MSNAWPQLKMCHTVPFFNYNSPLVKVSTNRTVDHLKKWRGLQVSLLHGIGISHCCIEGISSGPGVFTPIWRKPFGFTDQLQFGMWPAALYRPLLYGQEHRNNRSCCRHSRHGLTLEQNFLPAFVPIVCTQMSKRHWAHLHWVRHRKCSIFKLGLDPEIPKTHLVPQQAQATSHNGLHGIMFT